MLIPKGLLTFPKQISIFNAQLFCCLQMLSIWTSPKFCFWQRVNNSILITKLKGNLNFRFTTILLFANAFNLEKSKILSVGKELKTLS